MYISIRAVLIRFTLIRYVFQSYAQELFSYAAESSVETERAVALVNSLDNPDYKVSCVYIV